MSILRTAADHFFDMLPGQWELQRMITRPEYRLSGKAEFKKQDPETIIYQESGTNPALHQEFYNSYKFRKVPGTQDNSIIVYFNTGPNTGRIFHTLKFKNEHKAEGKFQCGNDLYETDYILESEITFTITHNVYGPAKNYRSISLFKRVA